MTYIGRQPYIRAPYTVQVTVAYLFYGQPFSQNFYWNTIDAEWTPAMQLAIASETGTYAINRFMPLLAQDVSLWKVICKNLDNDAGYTVEIPYFGYNGGIGSPGRPINVCYRMNTYRGRRRSVPLFYYPIGGIPDAATFGNEILPDYAQEWVYALAEYQDIFTGFEAYLVGVSYRKNNAWREEALIYYNVSPQLDHLDLGQRRKRLKNQVH